MTPRQSEQGLENYELNRALAWLKARRRKLLGARLALSAFYTREPANREFQAPLAEDDCDWNGYSHGVIREQLVPMTDNRALNECRKRARQLLKAIAAHLDLGHQDQADACAGELRAIRAFLAEVNTPQGRIRSFVTTRVKNYQANMQAWYYLLAKAEKEAPEVFKFLLAHVRPGDPFLWLD